MTVEAEVLEPPAKLELRPQMGLANWNARDDYPWLQITAKKRNGQLLANVHARLTALVIRPDTHGILYLECAATSTSVAHAIMAAAVESNNTVQTWAFLPFKPGSRGTGYALHPPDLRVADTKLQLSGHSGLHHFAMLSQSDDWILADSDACLWAKLRKKMSCPTKDEWGEVLLPKVLSSGALIECEAFGLPSTQTPCTKCEGLGRVPGDSTQCTCATGHAPCSHCTDGEPCEQCDGSGRERTGGMKVYVLELDAETTFDHLCGDLVTERGL
jgi:hypothetical protein